MIPRLKSNQNTRESPFSRPRNQRERVKEEKVSTEWKKHASWTQ